MSSGIVPEKNADGVFLDRDPSASSEFPVGLSGFGEYHRLSSKKTAYVAVSESGVVGNPEFARDDKGEGAPVDSP